MFKTKLKLSFTVPFSAITFAVKLAGITVKLVLLTLSLNTLSPRYFTLIV